MRKAIFTIVSNNYLHFARTLFESAAVHHPDCDRLCVVVDSDTSVAVSLSDAFAVVGIDELALPHPRRFVFRYSILELNTAVKPFAFAALFARGYDQVVYLDPDIRLYAPMQAVFERLDADADIVLTPHLLSPMTDAGRPSELDIRVAGTYNLGFCALARRDAAKAFVSWWQDKLVDRCLIDFAAGIFVDQSWVDLVPGLFGNVSILRDPGYNVAYWNLAQRGVRRVDGHWTVDGGPLVFFHFSGLDPSRPQAFSKHQDRFTLATIGSVDVLVIDYAEAVRANGAEAFGALPYGFGCFDDGTAIPDFLRETYRADGGLQRLMGDNPFSQSSILTALVPSRQVGRRATTRAMDALWQTRAEVRREFPLTDDASIERYWHWFVAEAPKFVAEPVARAHAAMLGTMSGGPSSAAAWLLPRGWFFDEGNVADAGAWVMPEAAIPVRLYGDAELVVEGYYEAECVERQTGTKGAVLHVLLRDALVLELILDTSGPFAASAMLPADSPLGTAELVFRCSGHFVPHAIGIGDDFRSLAWRARRITLGGDVLLDAARRPPIEPLDALVHVEGVDLVGYLAAESGVGESVRAFARACDAVGLGYSACDVGYQNTNRQTDASLDAARTATSRYGINVLHVNADQTPATLAVLQPVYRAAGITIAYWHWEQPVLPMPLLPSFEGLTEVWVPSAFVHEAVATIAPIPVFKVPHAIEFAVPASPERSVFGLRDDRFCVLAMYDLDSSSYRKNPLAAVEAFRRAFGSRTDATLVVKTINADHNPDAYRELLDAIADLPDVRLIDRYLDRHAVYALEAACDCFVSLHRAEGFGLALAEMMYLGKPVVATGWSGNMEFMTPMNSFPIDYALKPLARTIGVYERGPAWAEADVDQAAHVLARLVDDATLRRATGTRAATHMRRHFAPARIGSLYRKRLGLLSLRRPR